MSSLISGSFVLIVCLGCIAQTLSFGSWNKVPYSVRYGGGQKKLRIATPAPALPSLPLAPAIHVLNPSKLLSRSGLIGAGEGYYDDAGSGLSWGNNGAASSSGPVIMLRPTTYHFAPSDHYPQQIQFDSPSYGWQAPNTKNSHSSQYISVQKLPASKPTYIQNLIPLFPISGKLSEILTWFSDPHGHRFGFNQQHSEKHGHHGHGWNK